MEWNPILHKFGEVLLNGSQLYIDWQEEAKRKNFFFLIRVPDMFVQVL